MLLVCGPCFGKQETKHTRSWEQDFVGVRSALLCTSEREQALVLRDDFPEEVKSEIDISLKS